MKNLNLIFVLMLLFSCQPNEKQKTPVSPDYLSILKAELQKKSPENRTINLVFHGHSVPAGYFVTPVVNTFGSYPFLLLKELKEIYPFAVINVINTAIGGENSKSGAQRFDTDVLTHKPDIIFIDYGLNDRPIGLGRARNAWEEMIEKALEKNIKVVLLTPSPDLTSDILDAENELAKHAAQIRKLSEKYSVGLVDVYEKFRQIAASGDSLSKYMSQLTHPNEKGHAVIAGEILQFFK
jgi:lysophospholipase L1-like esterase